MLIIAGQQRTLARAIQAVADDAIQRVQAEMVGLRSVGELTAKIIKLKGEVSDLEIAKATREEEFARREREVEHKVGLERKRQEFELESGKRDAVLKVREENLAADKKRFEEQMAFHEKRFAEEVGYLKNMVAQVLERLPDVNVALEGAARGKSGR